MNYYFDSIYGNDKNDGLSRQTAFQSLEKANSLLLTGGDSLLFKAGCEFKGNLKPIRKRGTGLIKIDRYGVGKKPEIISENGNSIELSDFDDVELQNISMTNPEGVRGIHIINTIGGALKHIHIKNCKIKGVNEKRSTYAYESGGIICGSFSEEPGWFEDLLLEDNKIEDVARTGILLTSFWANRPTKLWGKNEYVDDNTNWWPSTGVVIRGNYIDRTGGDGIVIIGTIDALMEWNQVFHVMTNPVPPCANAGIWPQSSNGCVMQYNEVGYCHKPEGCNDAQGYDVDLSCRNTLIQYNYSHDNEGGFLLLCELGDTKDEHNFTGTVVRNNLSINDGNTKGELIALVNPVREATIENNTFYSSGNVDRIVEVWTPDGENQAKDVKINNNIFISNGRDNQFNLANGENFSFDSNIYWGTHRTVPESHQNPIVEDPMLTLPGIDQNGILNGKNYMPKTGSPALGNGILTEASSNKDYFGKDTKKINYIGAFVNNELGEK